MIMKQANSLINLGSIALRLIIMFYFAVLLGKFTWWLITPSAADIYSEKLDVMVFEKSSKFIISRSPFGKVIAPLEAEKPAIVSQMKLTGIYYNTPKNSIAFYELNNKSYIAKVGDTIGGTAILKSITPDSIFVSENDNNAEVTISGGASRHNPDSRNTSVLNSTAPSTQTPSNNDNQNNLAQSAESGQFGSEDSAEKRRKLIEDFVQRRSNLESSNNKGSSSGAESR